MKTYLNPKRLLKAMERYVYYEEGSDSWRVRTCFHDGSGSFDWYLTGLEGRQASIDAKLAVLCWAGFTPIPPRLQRVGFPPRTRRLRETEEGG